MKQFAGHILLLLVVAIGIPSACFSQKAYVTNTYKATTQRLVLMFNLAEGYFSGNELKLLNKTTGKTTRFLPENNLVEENKPTKFYHYSPAGKKFNDYFLVEGLKESFETPPAKFVAWYYNRPLKVKFVLYKKR